MGRSDWTLHTTRTLVTCMAVIASSALLFLGCGPEEPHAFVGRFQPKAKMTFYHLEEVRDVDEPESVWSYNTIAEDLVPLFANCKITPDTMECGEQVRQEYTFLEHLVDEENAFEARSIWKQNKEIPGLGKKIFVRLEWHGDAVSFATSETPGTYNPLRTLLFVEDE